MYSCNCLNITLEIRCIKPLTISKDCLDFVDDEEANAFFDQDQWHMAELCNIKKTHSSLIKYRKVGFWTVTYCLNCEVPTHAVHETKGASCVLIYSKLLNEEAIKDVKSSDLVSTIFDVIVNPNAIGPDQSILDTYQNKNVATRIKDFNDIITNYIRREQAAVEERIKKYSDEQYELLNTLKDKAYKEREALVRIIQNAAVNEDIGHDLSPKAPKFFINVSELEFSSNSPSEGLPFSPKRPKSTGLDNNPKNPLYQDDLVFNFENEELNDSLRYTKYKYHATNSDSEDLEEGEDIVNSSVTGRVNVQGKTSAGSVPSIAKSCPVDIPIFSQSTKSKIGRSDEYDEDDNNNSPRISGDIDIAASIKALAKSVHGDTIFGELPRPKFSTQI